MTKEINIFVVGNPATQGSKRHVGNGVMIESCKRLKPWRQDIREALTTHDGQPSVRLEGAVSCSLEFILVRPKSTPKRSTPPAIKANSDLDKLTRAVFDAITSSGVIPDDSRITEVYAKKRIALIGETSGLKLNLRECHP